MIYKLKGVVQHYDWGGYKMIPLLLGQENNPQQPWAEYWMGTHPKGAAVLEIDSRELELSVVLAKNPDYLGDKVLEQFGELPFLFKVLDVRQMLSIQLHPTKKKAEKGFAKEEALGIPRLAPNRNYKDQNHKPEVMVALTDFWLLHGFKDEKSINEILNQISAWNSLLPILKKGGIKALYKEVMSMSQEKVDELLAPLLKELKEKQSKYQDFNKDEATYWAWQAFQNYTRDGHFDRGIFSIYFFNLLKLEEGEGIYQGAGIPHAYLEGVNIELMANSDNVLRGGLTPKHIDVSELLDNIITDAVIPSILQAKPNEKGITNYVVPIDDFSLDKICLEFEDTIEIHQKGPAIYLIIAGELSINGVFYRKGEAFFVSDGTDIILENNEGDQGVIYRAYV